MPRTREENASDLDTAILVNARVCVNFFPWIFLKYGPKSRFGVDLNPQHSDSRVRGHCISRYGNRRSDVELLEVGSTWQRLRNND